MEIEISDSACFVFDLDDTLYLEREFQYSAFRSIAGQVKELTGIDCLDEMIRLSGSGENVFEWLESSFGAGFASITTAGLLHHYRHHQPSISLARGAAIFLQQLTAMNLPMGIITDGRSITQRNKLKALGIETRFSEIIISEEFGSAKPDPRNYSYFMKRYPSGDFYFFGDNTARDFQAPLSFGWNCYCIKNNGHHIHPQTFNDQLPVKVFTTFDEIRLVKKQNL